METNDTLVENVVFAPVAEITVYNYENLLALLKDNVTSNRVSVLWGNVQQPELRFSAKGTQILIPKTWEIIQTIFETVETGSRVVVVVRNRVQP